MQVTAQSKDGLRVTKNTLVLIAREGLNKGALFILFILIARFSGKETLGRYSMALAVSQIFFFGMDLGLNILVIRDVAKDRSLAGKFVVNIEALRFVLGLVTMGLIGLAVMALGARGETAVVIYLCGLSYFLINIANIYTSIFRAFEKMELEIFVAAIKAVIFLPAAVWMLFNKFGLIAIFNCFLISNIAALIAAKIILLRQIRLPCRQIDINFIKEQLSKTLPLWASQMFEISYLRVAPLLLFKIKGEGAVGIYNAGFVVVDGMLVLATCFTSAFFPMLSRLGHVSLSEAKRGYFMGLKSIGIIFIALGAVIILAAAAVVPFFYSRNFSEVVVLFRIFAVASVLVALALHSNLTLIATGKQHAVAVINGIGLLANLIFNAFFIIKSSYVGSAYAFVLSETLVLGLMLFTLEKSFFKISDVR